MNEISKKWKSRLLSSSLPLEYETAKCLAEMGFSVTYDFPYYRKDGNERKEFSTDIHARNYLFNTQNSKCTIEILAECKYREEAKKWIFLPEINNIDMSNQTLGYTIRKHDTFSKEKIGSDELYDFENTLEFSLKGVEVNEISGEVFDKDIKHGIFQLKFALPYLLKSNIESNIYGHLEDCHPWFTIPILVTNCDLFLLHEHFSIDVIKEANSVDEIAEKVPYLVCYSDIGPDFMEHHKKVFKNFSKELIGNENLLEFEKIQKELRGKYGLTNTPARDCLDLESSYKHILMENYTHFLICSFKHFPSLVNGITEIITKLNSKK